MGQVTIAPPNSGTVSAIDVELDYQSRTDYQPVYLGTAVPGTPLSDPIWDIRFITYDSSSRMLSIQNAVGAWNNRTTLTYD